jgi:cation diffusion facilitator family transporter
MPRSGPEHFTNELKAGQRVTWAGVVANAFLIVLKLLAGIFGHSQALIADAIHSVSDFFTDIVVLVGLKMGRKAPDADHHFGHARIETSASGIVGIFLVAVAIFIGYDSARDIYHHTESHPTLFAIAGAAISILVKELLYRYTVIVGRRINSTAVIANAWHHRSDALSSIAVLFGVTAAQLRPDWHILDAYAALLVSFFIIKVALDIMREALREITDTAPDPEVVEKIKSCIRGVPNVHEIHDLKIRMVGGRYDLSVHVVVDPALTVMEGHEAAEQVEQCFAGEVEDVGEVTVHVDPIGVRDTP